MLVLISPVYSNPVTLGTRNLFHSALPSCRKHHNSLSSPPPPIPPPSPPPSSQICDFGLARLRDLNTTMTANVGTVQVTNTATIPLLLSLSISPSSPAIYAFTPPIQLPSSSPNHLWSRPYSLFAPLFVPFPLLLFPLSGWHLRFWRESHMRNLLTCSGTRSICTFWQSLLRYSVYYSIALYYAVLHRTAVHSWHVCTALFCRKETQIISPPVDVTVDHSHSLTVILSCPILSCLSHLISSYLTISHLVLSYLIPFHSQCRCSGLGAVYRRMSVRGVDPHRGTLHPLSVTPETLQ